MGLGVVGVPRFPRRLRPVLREFEDGMYEAVFWYRDEGWARRKTEELRWQGFRVRVTFEDWWAGWFVWVGGVEDA